MIVDAGSEKQLASIVQVFGGVRPHHAYLFVNRRHSMKVLAHDGIGIWLASRLLNQDRFDWQDHEEVTNMTRAQFDAFVLGTNAVWMMAY